MSELSVNKEEPVSQIPKQALAKERLGENMEVNTLAKSVYVKQVLLIVMTSSVSYGLSDD